MKPSQIPTAVTTTTAPTMSELLQKSLNIRDDGRCQLHPDVTVLEQGASCLGKCRSCALEAAEGGKQKGLGLGDTPSTLSSSFLFGGLSNSNSKGDDESKEQQQPQPLVAEEVSAEQKQQQALLESILARWVQVQVQVQYQQGEGGATAVSAPTPLPPSIIAALAPTAPWLLHNDLVQKLASKVEEQEVALKRQQTTIDDLKKSLEEKHASTQVLLQTILKQVTAPEKINGKSNGKSNGNTHNKIQPDTAAKLAAAAVAAAHSLVDPPSASDAAKAAAANAAKKKNGVPATNITTKKNDKKNDTAANKQEEIVFRATPSVKSPKYYAKQGRRGGTSVCSSQRSVDTGVKQPLTRHDSNRSGFRDIVSSSSRRGIVTPTAATANAKAKAKPAPKRQTTPALSKTHLSSTSNSKSNSKHQHQNQTLESASNHSAGANSLQFGQLNLMNDASNRSSRSQDIALEGSQHSLERTNFPDLDAIFENGLGDELKSGKLKKFNLPANYTAQLFERPEPMEIILESANNNNNINNNSARNVASTGGTSGGGGGGSGAAGDGNAAVVTVAVAGKPTVITTGTPTGIAGNHSERKLLPSSPAEVGLEFDVGQPTPTAANGTNNNNTHINNMSKNAMLEAAAAVVLHQSMTNFPTQDPIEIGVAGHMSLLTFDAGLPPEAPDHDSDLSESAYEAYDGSDVDDDDDANLTYQLKDDEDEDEDDDIDDDDDDDNDYAMEALKNVTQFLMIDMYGDQGTYSGTVGPAENDPTGFGTMKYDSSRFYKGEWKKGRWNGKGTLLNANGDSYQGDFVSDARHGKGVYRFTSGDVYEGDFFEDNRHGRGKFKFHNGSVYEGDFCMGSFEGFGKYDFEGGYYEGDWRRDEYYGTGKLKYKDGSNYRGRFKRGSAHGFGEEQLADGTVRIGLWRRGEFIQECNEEECKKLEHKQNRPPNSRRNQAKRTVSVVST